MWLPHKTVATIVERDQHFLMVEEIIDGLTVFNQPAGHLEAGETLLEAAARETLEETRWQVKIDSFLGLYQYTSSANEICYIRTCFVAEPVREFPEQPLDAEIIAVHWMTMDDIRNQATNLRSPVVLQVLEDYKRDYQQGVRHPLSLVTSL